MTSLESIQPNNCLAEDVPDKIRNILYGTPSNDYNRRQIQLIFEKALKEKPDVIFDNDHLNNLGFEWANSKFSEAFSLIARDLNFKDHPRFQGNIANITLEDVEYAIQNKKIPEN